MTSRNNAEALEQIRANIAKFGWHVYIVIGDPCPRWAYTVGSFAKIGTEFIFAGGAYYNGDQVRAIINQITAEVIRAGKCVANDQYDLGELGVFHLRNVDDSWARLLLLGAFDYYNCPELPAWQIVPGALHHTADIPALWLPYNPATALPWQWLTIPWPFAAPATATATTNLPALRGSMVTEVMRWELDDWEMFAGAGPDVPRADLRVVPLGLMIATDPSLSIVESIEVGKGLWRDADELAWHEWG